MTYTEIQKQILTTQWPAETLERINSALPSLGPSTLNFLSNNYEGFGNNYASTISQVIVQIPKWQKDIAEGREDNFQAELVKVLQSGDLTIIELLSAFIYDVHRNHALSGHISESLSRSMIIFQMANIENLPSIEIIEGLMYHSLDLAMIFNLESEMKRLVYYKGYDLDNREVAACKNSLEISNQLLVSSQFRVDGQLVDGSVKNFIKDFNIFAAGLPTKSSSYAVAQYLTTSPVVKPLDKTSRQVLTRVLEAYTWLFSGYTTANEVSQYEISREEIIEQLYKFVIDQSTEVYSTEIEQVVPTSSPVKLPEFDSARATPSANINTPKANPVPPVQVVQHAPPKSPVHLAAPTPFDEIVSQMPKQKMGVVMDPTNIKINEEKQRLEVEKASQAKRIQQKLADLRKRNNQQP